MLTYSLEVREALKEKRPLVALESTVIAHGLPYPDNEDVTHAMMRAVRAAGATPAVIAVMDGRIHIGLEDEELAYLAKATDVLKLSVADIGYCLAQKRLGATTVSATLKLAHMAGIRIFATGGLGGVHRGAEETFDISADLHALKTFPVGVVASGVKSILDVPKTLEFLETLGVPIVGYGDGAFALFWARGGPALGKSVCDAIEAARVLDTHLSLNLGGLLFSNPIPTQNALSKQDIEEAIEKAIQDGHAQGITGKAVTPFLLKTMASLTQGKSLVANKALLVQNAHTAGEIAAALALQERRV
ncbi:MAG: pseudouridine-5-phosphate glycosidase [Candidatus Puniceispirillum sp.]|nr:pseudouridine-5-phosphate glycosidase [Candidatus Puniceispirillum sp.]